ncbi:hypothetical protein JZ751_013816 [Albula glossodonta]|uniref:Uncharacterized protein n=1 Tax=Albula glossodonta TaxID=121402 RepID=A0A8T2NVV8_9TELE|nr:hypothetical protein JZ751_013816 [Albula glossodonta]
MALSTELGRCNPAPNPTSTLFKGSTVQREASEPTNDCPLPVPIVRTDTPNKEVVGGRRADGTVEVLIECCSVEQQCFTEDFGVWLDKVGESFTLHLPRRKNPSPTTLLCLYHCGFERVFPF